MRSLSGIGNRPKDIFLGVRRDASGGLVEEWTHRDDLQAETRARVRLINLVSMAGATGITGKSIGRLLDTYGYKYDGNEPISRRGFLRATAATAAAGAIGCEGSPTSNDTGPDPDNEPVEAIITGPGTLQIPSLGVSVSAEFDGSWSTPTSLSRYWRAWKEVDAFGEGDRDLGNWRKVTADFTRPGMYTVELRVTNSGIESKAVHPISVLPPPLPGDDYPLIAFLRNDEDGSSFGRADLYVLNPISNRITRLGGGPGSNFIAQTSAWEKGGGRLATEAGISNTGIVVYDLLKDELVRVSTPGADFAWTVAWNPQKDWIAYAERGRGSRLEPVLVRPDGSERLYLSGDTYDQSVSGFFLSWSPDGERLALGRGPFISASPKLKRYMGGMM